MDYFMVLKMTGKGTKKGKSVLVTRIGKRGKPIRIVGNIPELYYGMIVKFELESNFAKDYEIYLNDKNVKALEKAGIDKDEYQNLLSVHKTLKDENIGWEELILADGNFYNIYPFEKADKIHKLKTNNPEDKKRLDALNNEIIKIGRNKRKLYYSIEEFLGYFDAAEQEGAYEQLLTSVKILSLNNPKYNFCDSCVYDLELQQMEEFIKKDITQREKRQYELLTPCEIEEFLLSVKDRGLAEEQLNVVNCMLSSNPCVITGGAGTGKTTVIKTLIDCYAMHYNTKQVLLIAPTGKASRRLAEKTGMESSTIHKALRKSPEDDYVYYNEKHKLPHRLIIIDESSMIDTILMYEVLSAVDETSKIVFVGDCNQLYPVGCGEPFMDFIDNIETYRLLENHRQEEGTDILNNAQNVLEDKEIFNGRGVFIETIPSEYISKIIEKADKNTQIITPYNDLNAEINQYLKLGENEFNKGDKVMTLKNTEHYCNGDIGYVVGIDEIGTVYVDIEGTEVAIKQNDLKEHLTLAYAITVHKMQGSEADKIIFIVPKNNMQDKRMWYTAITRARHSLEIYKYTEGK